MSRRKHPQQNFLQKHFHSLPARILAVFVIQAFITLILLTLIGIFIVQGKTQERIPLLLNDYIERLIVGLPSPITRSYLFQLKHETGLHFGYQKDRDWLILTEPKLQAFFEKEAETTDWISFKNHPGWRWQFERGHLLVVVPHEGGKLWIHFGLRKKERDNVGFWMALGVITLMLILTYLWVSYLLRPIKDIQKGVHHFSDGDFAYRLPIKGKSDLTKLSETINHMACEIANRLQKEHELFIAMSHELRTPLSRMRVAIEMLEDEHIQTVMLRSLHAMEQLIEALLHREQAQQSMDIEKQEIDPELIWRWIRDDFPEDTANINLQTEALNFVSDAFLLRLILKNLIANALKYSEQKPVTVGIKRYQKGVDIWVQDQGIGLSDKEKENLFEPFFRADRARARQTGGLGLGLYLSQAMAKRLGSRIEVVSQPNEGSRFNLIIR